MMMNVNKSVVNFVTIGKNA